MAIGTVEFDERVQLKKAVHEGDRKAIHHLYTKHKKFIQLYIRSAGSFDGQIDDLVHETFLAICERKGKYRQETDARGYLCGIVKNIILKHLRKTNSQIRAGSINDLEAAVSNKLIDKASPLQEVIYIEEFSRVIPQMLSRLSAKSRQAVILVLFEKLRPKEAAAKAGCSVNAFYQRLQGARKTLEGMNAKL